MKFSRLASLLLLFFVPDVFAAQFSFQTLDDTLASPANGGTLASGISGSNVVGTYFDTNTIPHGFLYNGSNYITLDDTNSFTVQAGETNYFGTTVLGISGSNIVGWYSGSDTAIHGFLYAGGDFTTLDDPEGFLDTAAAGISGSTIVGNYVDINGFTHGFTLAGTNYTTLDDPNALNSPLGATYALGVDGTNIVGYYSDPANNGFLFNGSTYSDVDFPGAGGFSEATGIDGVNIVGFYADAFGGIHSFIDNLGTFSSFDFTGSSHTYATGISSNSVVGYYTDTSGATHGFLAVETSGVTKGNATALQVTITPAEVVSDGAQWQLDGGAFQNSGISLSNVSVGDHIISYNSVNGWIAPSNQIVTIVSNSLTSVVGIYALQETGSLEVTLGPAGAISNGAAWQVDGGPYRSNGVVLTNLAVGAYTISFEPVPGWNPPPNQAVVVSNEAIAMATGTYSAATLSANGLILVTNGSGTIRSVQFPIVLVDGNGYTVKAVPAEGYIFKNWVGGATLPYTVLSSSATLTFTMETGLLLEANFVPDPYVHGYGTYLGLFAPASGARQQTNSGSFKMVLTPQAIFSGTFRVGNQTIPISGKFDADGSAEVITKTRNIGTWKTALQLDFSAQSVTGTVSNDNGGFVSVLTGYQEISGGHNQATNFVGRYSLLIPGVTNPAVGPFGTSYGTVEIGPRGNLAFSGNLADGTSISQSSAILAGGNWPLYVPLDAGKGSLWSWVTFSTNGALASAPFASWINPTNSNKGADYRAGFTNQQATIGGGPYLAANQPVLILYNANVIFSGGDFTSLQTNVVTVASSPETITFSAATNHLSFMINRANGFISGSFDSPSGNGKLIKLNGVLTPPQGYAEGYFLGSEKSGAFSIIPY